MRSRTPTGDAARNRPPKKNRTITAVPATSKKTSQEVEMKPLLWIRGLAAALVMVGLLQAVQPAFALSEKDKNQVEQIVHDYLLKNPKLLEEMLAALQTVKAKEAADAAEKGIADHREALLSADPRMVAGNPDGDVTVVEFFDYRCPYCRLAQANISKLIEQDPKVRIVFKEYPVLGPESITASRAALASVKQGKYVPFHMAMMSLDKPLTDDLIYETAKSVGLDVKQLKDDMKDESIDKVISDNEDLAEKLGVEGTPNFIIGNQLLQGLVSYETMTDAISQARKKPAFKTPES
ncbi:MAG: thioredoxin domain-containing protein [Alphaproteobacteria bacterium]|nr:thioredoxin domain-containing protein [Alphaproteobacteria bacterium]